VIYGGDPRNLTKISRDTRYHSRLKGRVRGQYYSRVTAGTTFVLLEPDVGKAFPDGSRVNKARRTYLIARRSRQAAQVLAARGGTSIIKEFQPSRLKRGQFRGVDLGAGRTRKDESKCPREYARGGCGVSRRNIRESSLHGTVARDSTSVRPLGPDRGPRRTAGGHLRGGV
jgi:hypothetical protein